MITKKNVINIAIILFSIVIIFYLLFIEKFVENSEKMISASDFIPYFSAAKRIKNGQMDDIFKVDYNKDYEISIYGEILPYTPYLYYLNLPLVATAYIPYTHLNVITSYKIHAVISVFLISVSLLLLIREIPIKLRDMALVGFFIPIYGSIYYGQVSPLIFFILVLIFLALRKESHLLAGFLSGLLVIKFQYLLLFPYIFIIVKRKREYLITFAITLLVYMLANTALYGGDLFADLYFALFYSKTGGYGNGYFYNLMSLHKYVNTTILLISTVILYITSILMFVKNKTNLALEQLFSSAVIFSLGLNIHTMYTDLLFLLIPLVFFLTLNKNLAKYFLVSSIYVIAYIYVFKLEVIAGLLLIVIGFSTLLTKQTNKNLSL